MTFINRLIIQQPPDKPAGLLRSLCFRILETFLYGMPFASLPNLHQHGNQNDSDVTSAGELGGGGGEEIPRKCQPGLFQPCGLLPFISALNSLTFMLNQLTSLLAVT